MRDGIEEMVAVELEVGRARSLAALERFESFRPREELGDYASDRLIEKISGFISAEPRPKD